MNDICLNKQRIPSTDPHFGPLFEQASSKAFKLEEFGSSHYNRSSNSKNQSIVNSMKKFRREGLSASKMRLLHSRGHSSRFSGVSTQASTSIKSLVLNLFGAINETSELRVLIKGYQDSTAQIVQWAAESNHPHILQINDLQISNNQLSFTTTPIKMSLMDLIRSYKDAEKPIQKDVLMRYCSELINGFQYLREVYPDLDYIEPSCILIDHNDQIKIADFGDLRFVYDERESSLMIKNKLRFSQVSQLLEAISERNSNLLTSCQSWNIGAILAGLCTLKVDLISNSKLYTEGNKSILKKKLKNLDLFYGKKFIKLLLRLFDAKSSQKDVLNLLLFHLASNIPSDEEIAERIQEERNEIRKEERKIEEEVEGEEEEKKEENLEIIHKFSFGDTQGFTITKSNISFQERKEEILVREEIDFLIEDIKAEERISEDSEMRLFESLIEPITGDIQISINPDNAQNKRKILSEFCDLVSDITLVESIMQVPPKHIQQQLASNNAQGRGEILHRLQTDVSLVESIYINIPQVPTDFETNTQGKDTEAPILGYLETEEKFSCVPEILASSIQRKDFVETPLGVPPLHENNEEQAQNNLLFGAEQGVLSLQGISQTQVQRTTQEIDEERVQMDFLLRNEHELSLFGDVSVISIEISEDLLEDDFDLIHVLQSLHCHENFPPENYLLNIVYTSLIGQRPSLLHISYVQLDLVITSISEMIKSKQITLKDFRKYKTLKNHAPESHQVQNSPVNIKQEVGDQNKEEFKENNNQAFFQQKGPSMNVLQNSPEPSQEEIKEIPQTTFISKSKVLSLREESGKIPRFFSERNKEDG